MNKILTSLVTGVLLLSLTSGIALAKGSEVKNDDLGGLDLNSYCSHLGLSNDSHVKLGTQNWYCTTTNNDAKYHIKIGEACEWQYPKSVTGVFAGTSKEVVPGDPYTYNCFF